MTRSSTTLTRPDGAISPGTARRLAPVLRSLLDSAGGLTLAARARRPRPGRGRRARVGARKGPRGRLQGLLPRGALLAPAPAPAGRVHAAGPARRPLA